MQTLAHDATLTNPSSLHGGARCTSRGVGAREHRQNLKDIYKKCRGVTVEYFDVIVTPLFLSYQMGADTILTGNAREVAPVQVRPRLPGLGKKHMGIFEARPGMIPTVAGWGVQILYLDCRIYIQGRQVLYCIICL